MASMLAISQHAGYKYIYFLQNLDIYLYISWKIYIFLRKNSLFEDIYLTIFLKK